MNNSSNVNTIVIVIVLLILVGGGVGWYKTYGPGMTPATDENKGLQINIGGSSDAMDNTGGASAQ